LIKLFGNFDPSVGNMVYKQHPVQYCLPRYSQHITKKGWPPPIDCYNVIFQDVQCVLHLFQVFSLTAKAGFLKSFSEKSHINDR
jgi:hypothetical protein